MPDEFDQFKSKPGNIGGSTQDEFDQYRSKPKSQVKQTNPPKNPSEWAGRLWETMPAGGEGESSAQRVPCGAVARSSGRVRTARVQACHPDGPSPRTGRWQLLT